MTTSQILYNLVIAIILIHYSSAFLFPGAWTSISDVKKRQTSTFGIKAATTSQIEIVANAFKVIYNNSMPHERYQQIQYYGSDSIPIYGEEAHIIQCPNDSLSTKLIDFRPSLVVDDIMKDLKKNPTRTPLFAIVRGRGGGNTRALEEIQAAFLRHNGEVLPIAITFNHRWSARIKDHQFVTASQIYEKYPEKPYPEEVDVVNINTGLAVITRVTSMFYGIKYEDAYDTIKSTIANGTIPLYPKGEDDVKTLLRGLKSHLLDKVRMYRPRANKFLLLIDEAVALKEIMEKQFSAKNVDEMYIPIRRMADKEGGISDIRVVISSLDDTLISQTLSGREIKTISLPSNLNTTEIVNIWWHRNLSDFDLFCNNTSAFQLLAGAVSNNPRLVEKTQTNIFNVLNETKDMSEPVRLNPTFNTILSEVFTDVKDYFIGELPTGSYLYALITKKLVEIDDTVSRYIMKSIFTNSLTKNEIKIVGDPPQHLIPEASPIILAALADGPSAISDSSSILIKDLFSSILESPTDVSGFGNMLENIGVARLKLVVTSMFESREDRDLIKTKQRATTFLDFFPIDKRVSSLPRQFDAVVNEKNQRTPRLIDKLTLPRISKTSAFISYLKNSKHQLSEKDPVIVFNSAKGEHFDAMICLLDTENLAHAFFIDFKSGNPQNDMITKDIKRIGDLPKNGTQYTLTKEYVTLIKELTREIGDGSITESTALDAIVNDRWSYIYLQTGVIKKSYAIENETAIYMGDDDSKKFLGIFYNLYAAVRSTYEEQLQTQKVICEAI